VTITDEAGRHRLENEKDWVRLEISRALTRGIRVIPVLISGSMPRETDIPADLKPLLTRQALELSDRHWRQDLELLAQALEKVPGVTRRVSTPQSVLTKQTDLSEWVRIRDSGPEGSVAGLAVVTAMEASLAQQKRPVTLSARYLYEKAKRMNRYGPKEEGTDMSAALYIAETFGAPPEDRWPYIAGSRDLPKGVTWTDMDAAAAKFRARTFRLSRYEDIPQQLAQGHPVLATAEVTDGWMSDEAAKTGITKVTDNEKLVGGHAIVIVGFNPDDSQIKFANSWGVNWGVNGFGSMSAQSARRALKEMWAIDVPPSEP